MLATAAKQKIAKDFGLVNVSEIAQAAYESHIPFYAACALMQMESNGKNIYGSDLNGTLADYPYPPNEGNYEVFYWLVITKKKPANGVGPCQITYHGFHIEMKKQGLKCWDILDNMGYGMRLLKSLYDSNNRDWGVAGARYNGKDAYGVTFERRCAEWKKRLNPPA